MHRLVASFFHTGFLLGKIRRSDAGAGTVGSVFSLALGVVLIPLGWQAQVTAVAVLTVASLWSAEPFTREVDTKLEYATTKAHDPGWVVIDEAAGTMLAIIGLSNPLAIGAAFVVFRVADIFKRGFPGVAYAETLPGAWGVTFDDLVAGVYGLAAGWLIQSLLG